MSFEDFQSEPVPSPESEPNLLTESELTIMLRDRGIEDPEVRTQTIEYQRTLELASYAELDGNDERIKLSIHMARIYFNANYREYAVESLDELLLADMSPELREEIYAELDRMEDEINGGGAPSAF